MRRSISLVLVSLFLLPVVGSADDKPEVKSVGPDVPPELPMEVYAERRQALRDLLGTCTGAIKSYPGHLGFDPYFFYLTGIEEQGALLLLAPKSPINKESLYLEPRDVEAEVWTGYREELSPELRDKYMVDQVRRIRGTTPRGLGKALRRSKCYAKLRPAFAHKPAVDSTTLSEYLSSFEARSEQRWQQLENLRAVHGAEELERMDKAIAITKMGHEAAIANISADITERYVASKISDAFYEYGATGLAFDSIVGSGPNGAVLHWVKNDRAMAEGDMVVVDIGASYGGYAADITRSYPVDGSFDAKQLEVYNAVLAAQQKVIDAVKPGISLDRLHQIGEQAIIDAGYQLPHGIGHFVGLEVHDVGDSGAPLEAGMVITVEPGIYIQDEFGVRIEDMVLVTTKGSRLMTEDLPRSAAEVEAWMKKVRQ